MPNLFDRREFIARTSAWGAAAALALNARAGEAPPKRLRPEALRKEWRLACQLYTFRDRSFYEALEVMASLGIRNVEPCFFLPLDKDRPELKTSEELSPDVRRELRKRLSDSGVKMANYYAPLGADTTAFRKVFDFAKEMGVETLVAEPPHEVFDSLEALCKEYRINLAVHNHPKSPESRYWRPENVLEVCKGRDKRVGACPDTGHWVRSALDPLQCLEKMRGRIIALHLKDVAEVGKPEARDVPLGTGKADYTRILEALRAQGFKGVMTIEYEHLSPQLPDDVAKCVKFVNDFIEKAA